MSITNYTDNSVLTVNYTALRWAKAVNPVTVNYTTLRWTEALNTLLVDYATPLVYWMPNIPLKVNYTNINYFPSWVPVASVTFSGEQIYVPPSPPVLAEYLAKYAVKVYFQTPDASTTETQILADDVGEVTLKWAVNSPIIWSLVLKNYDRKYTTGAYKEYIKERIYSPALASRIFIKIEFKSFSGTETKTIAFPRLVIKEVQGTSELTISGIDEISEYLFRRQNFSSYVSEEALARVSGSLREFVSDTLTENSINPYTSEILVNYQLAQYSNVSYNSATRKLTFNYDIEEHYPVVLVNPLYAKFVIQDICEKAIDEQTTGITKEYFDVNLNFTDFQLFSEIFIQNIELIQAIEQILEVVPGEWIIEPVGDKLSFCCYETVIDNAFPKVPDFYFPETLLRSYPNVQKSQSQRINTINVIRPSVLRTAYKQIEVIS